jgi:hypothetical protein
MSPRITWAHGRHLCEPFVASARNAVLQGLPRNIQLPFGRLYTPAIEKLTR